MKISEQLTAFGSDKCTDHSYGQFYDDLFARLKPKRILEVGVYHGASAKAWCSLDHVERFVGVDKKDPGGLPEKCTVIEATTPDFREIVNQLDALPPFDLIIDDGSHTPLDQIAAAFVLLQFLAPGGVYVVEDIAHDKTASIFREAGWRIMDLRSEKNRWDDILAIYEEHHQWSI